jgi:hypothetical protein
LPARSTAKNFFTTLPRCWGFAAEVDCLGSFKKNKTQAKRTATAKDALIYLWDYLGWTGSKRPVALGLIGPLHSEFAAYRNIAQRLCRRFDARFPFANL